MCHGESGIATLLPLTLRWWPTGYVEGTEHSWLRVGCYVNIQASLASSAALRDPLLVHRCCSQLLALSLCVCVCVCVRVRVRVRVHVRMRACARVGDTLR